MERICLLMWETWVQSLGWQDPLEKEMATIPVFWTGKSCKEGPGGLKSTGSQRVGHDLVTKQQQ